MFCVRFDTLIIISLTINNSVTQQYNKVEVFCFLNYLNVDKPTILLSVPQAKSNNGSY